VRATTARSPAGSARTPRAPRRHRPQLHRRAFNGGALRARRGHLYGTGGPRTATSRSSNKRWRRGPARWIRRVRAFALNDPGRIDPNAGFARTAAQADTLSAIFGRQITPFQPFTYNVSEQLWETGTGNVASLSVSGGGERATYFASGRYQGEDGPFTSARVGGIARDVLSRYQGTLGLNVFPRERLTLSFQSRYSAQTSESPEGSNSIYSPYAQAMYARPDQAYCLGPNGQRALGEAVAGPARCSGAGNPFGNTFSATVRETTVRTIPQDVAHYNGSLGAKWTPTAELSLDATGGLDYTDTRNVNFWPFGNRVDLFNANAPEGLRSVGNVRQRNVTIDVKGSWDRA
jgi:hypothetical protein